MIRRAVVVPAQLMAREERRFVQGHPRSAALFERARRSLLGGVPMNWMSKWPGPFPPFVAEASGGHFSCVGGQPASRMPSTTSACPGT